MTLKAQAILLLKNRPKWLTYKQIRKETGIPAGWLSMLVQGRIDGPNVNRIETIINYLNNLHVESKY